jgi:hypothetical protein
VTALHGTTPPPAWLPGWRVRVVDGNHLPHTDKRLAATRDVRGAALPGVALVVYDPEAGLVVDVAPCEDAYAGEATVATSLIAAAAPGDLWLLDRNFATRGFFDALLAHDVDVLAREKDTIPNPTVVGRRRRLGRIETGVVYETPVTLPLANGCVRTLRRIEVELDAPTRDGDTVMRLLTTLPARVRGRTIARLYRKRWTIEAAFGRLEAALHSEVRTLGYPRAALFAFGLALVALNVLAVVETAIAVEHDLAATGDRVSTYQVANDVRVYYAGMMLAVDALAWATFDTATPAQCAATLRQLSVHADVGTLRVAKRGPKVPKPKAFVSKRKAKRHHATARLLAAHSERQ